MLFESILKLFKNQNQNSQTSKSYNNLNYHRTNYASNLKSCDNSIATPDRFYPF
ncbi:hypothetical protein DICPUDRAFT_152485 [Dictyostelium purpureum]|uniref:Uncharacterized protein n=1 Tax=Dictyostelium purpureum TaxID=5786 RepID=F0ZLH3_DICPU|nr:uncharacterized protein DICPUDRAFT_152485 [Dictyostelium purpureum]EGC35224.1 hypothetical protein DICPUDRAFT_152485 [Dictyostelium purpureum]|eukprot:XP_003288262.1 hypothetical protein DICPUDRAFT_152485 [Dictyostelium purpureum]